MVVPFDLRNSKSFWFKKKGRFIGWLSAEHLSREWATREQQRFRSRPEWIDRVELLTTHSTPSFSGKILARIQAA